jgi:pantetheine-phosphate adenylyltransferase/dephospho-CoA kinase
MTRYLYAFSGDPITRGHRNVVERILKTVNPGDELVVGIGVNPDKRYTFPLHEREEMARRYLKDLNVKVVSFEGMLSDYACENGFGAVFRGIRDEKDAREELNLYYALVSQGLGLEMYMIPANKEMTHISSSTVKAIEREHGRVHTLVPLHVKEALDAKMLGQYPLGFTGVSGAGKSYLCKALKKLASELGIPTYHIDVDSLGHQILGESDEELYRKTREAIIKEFGEGVAQPNGFINRKALGDIVFADKKKMDALNMCMHDPLTVKITRETYGEDKKGLILIDGALLEELGWTYLCNNNVVLVDADESTREKRLKDRGLDEERISHRKGSQYTTERKRIELLKRISEDGNGELWSIDNSENANPDMEKYLNAIVLKLDRYGELRFRGLWNRTGADGAPDAEYARLVDAYSKRHRYFHTLAHIVDGLNEMENIRHLMTNPDIAEFGWWWHDFAYEKQSKINEQRSALIAQSACKNAMLPNEFAEGVKAIILDTSHKAVPESVDGRFIADIDLSILGKDREIFDKYEENIRKEYRWVDGETFKAARASILQRFLERPNIYATDFFRKKYEEQARKNLARSLEKLK